MISKDLRIERRAVVLIATNDTPISCCLSQFEIQRITDFSQLSAPALRENNVFDRKFEPNSR